jgi:hypothetical protein
MVGGVQTEQAAAAASQSAATAGGSSASQTTGVHYAPLAPPHAMTSAERRKQVAQARTAANVAAKQRIVGAAPALSAKPGKPIQNVKNNPTLVLESTFGTMADTDGTVLGEFNTDNTPKTFYTGTAFQGQHVTVTDNIVEPGIATPYPEHVYWYTGCSTPGNFAEDTSSYDLGQVVTPSTLVDGNYVATVTLNVPVDVSSSLCTSLPGAAQGISFAVYMDLYNVNHGYFDGVYGDVEATVTQAVPAANEVGCNCTGNAAGFPQQPSLRGDPVNTSTGAFSESFTDASLPSAGAPLELARSYTSSDTTTGPLGTGWRLPWAMGLSFDASGNATFTDEEGRQFLYTRNSDGSFTPPVLARSSLVHNSAGTYTLTTLAHQVLVFTAGGQLASQKAGQRTGPDVRVHRRATGHGHRRGRAHGDAGLYRFAADQGRVL